MKERRATHRYKLVLPIRVRRIPTSGEGGFLQGEVHDISTSGIYFITNERFAEDDVLDFSLTLRGLTEVPEALITGRARVLRVAETTSEPLGVAAIIEKFHIVRSGLT
jgi:hypothetical protein